MHLGRFHATIFSLYEHFRKADLHAHLEHCAEALENYASSREAAHIEKFRSSLDKFYSSAALTDSDLNQPYASDVIDEIGVRKYLDPSITEQIGSLVRQLSFDQTSLAAELRKVASSISDKVKHISNINIAFTALEVEFERVSGVEGEVGVLLPREIVGETLEELTAEFGDLSKLFRAINELTGAQDYDPKIRTISSSSWQIFVGLDSAQIAAWVFAIERIVNLFKTNLEIKQLQESLSNKDVPKEIISLLDKEIESRVNAELLKISSDMRSEFSKISDNSRLNEVETQLRHGLRHMAKRINQGAHVEINVGLPEEIGLPVRDGKAEDENMDFIGRINKHKERLSTLRSLREKGQAVSAKTLSIDRSSPLLIDHQKNSIPR